MSRFVCTECGSDYVMERRIVHTMRQDHVVPFPVRCSNINCQRHDLDRQTLGCAKEVSD